MADTTIQALPNGPFKTSGTFVILDANGNQIQVDKDPIYLCRCGGSKKKPFCDGTHHTVVFDPAPEA